MYAHDLEDYDSSSSLPICLNLISNSEIETEKTNQKLTFQEIEKSYEIYLSDKTKQNEELYRCLKKPKWFVIMFMFKCIFMYISYLFPFLVMNIFFTTKF